MNDISPEAQKRAIDRLVTARNNPRQTTDHDKGTLVKIESLALQFAGTIEQYVPDGRLKSLALTHLEETLTWANKAVYTQGAAPGPALPDTPPEAPTADAPSPDEPGLRLAYVGKARGNIVHLVRIVDGQATYVASTPDPEPTTVPEAEFFAAYDRDERWDDPKPRPEDHGTDRLSV